MAADVAIHGEALVTIKQKTFLSNVANKYKFVFLLSQYMEQQNITTKVAQEDADSLITTTAIELIEQSQKPIAVVGNDVDLLVLLIGLTPQYQNVHFYKMAPGKAGNVLYSTSSHGFLKEYILFAHAFSGCDFTSVLFGKGKKTVFSLFKEISQLQADISIFYLPNQNIDELFSAVQKLVLQLYDAKSMHKTVNELRFKMFCSLLATAKK